MNLPRHAFTFVSFIISEKVELNTPLEMNDQRFLLFHKCRMFTAALPMFMKRTILKLQRYFQATAICNFVTFFRDSYL